MLLPLVAIGIAVLFGYAVTVGTEGHLAPAPGVAPPDGHPVGMAKTLPLPPLPALAMSDACADTLAALPTAGGDFDSMRYLVTHAYKTASSAPEDVKMLRELANQLMDDGYHDAGVCLRKRAADLERAGAGYLLTMPV